MNEEKNVEVKKQLVQDGVEVSQKIPRIMLEVLIYGLEKDKTRIKTLLDDIEIQINKSRKAKRRVRVLWYIDKGELSIDEKKKWLIDNSNCAYFVFVPETYQVSSKYISSMVDNIQQLEKSIQGMKQKGIQLKPMTQPTQITSTDE
jgi:hypothetical protein